MLDALRGRARRLNTIAGKLLATPADVTAFRARQQLRLLSLRRGGWERIARRSRDTVAALTRAGRFDDAALLSQVPVFVSPEGYAALRAQIESDRAPAAFDAIKADARGAMEGRYPVFGSLAPLGDGAPWDSDWRHGEQWRGAGPFNFYGARARSYDVKFPWELSRLKWLVDLLQVAVLTDADDHRARAAALLGDWIDRNPLGRTVNWVPMEASMRALALALALELACLSRTADASRLRARLVGSLIDHGEYIHATREYAHHRGNHYAANICALFHVGQVLLPFMPRARMWRDFARREIEREVTAQFLDDGVNFEKSASYHRLVTELFVTSAVIARRIGDPLPPLVVSRLERACRFAEATVEPDGTTMALGDSDDATGLVLGPRFPRNANELSGLADAFFMWNEGKAAASLSAGWAIAPALTSGEAVRVASSAGQLQRFDRAHLYVVQNGGDRFWCDLGEVGQNGLGGHGHNDLFGFALWLDGRPVFIDPGSYMYTGDLEARSWFRSTAAHNGFDVDGAEIAPLLGHWRIGNEAEPFDHCIEEDGDVIRLSAAHRGFGRLPSVGIARRTFTLAAAPRSLTIDDAIEAVGEHVIARYFHLDPAIRPVVDGTGATLYAGDQAVARLSAEDADAVNVVPSWCSRRYGEREPTQAIVLRASRSGSVRLQSQIQKAF